MKEMEERKVTTAEQRAGAPQARQQATRQPRYKTRAEMYDQLVRWAISVGAFNTKRETKDCQP